MVNINGTLVDTFTNQLSLENRGYKYGDALFETLKVFNSSILFWEDHYFRLMASMRILRMEIPMTFTMEFLEASFLDNLAIFKYEYSIHFFNCSKAVSNHNRGHRAEELMK